MASQSRFVRERGTSKCRPGTKRSKRQPPRYRECTVPPMSFAKGSHFMLDHFAGLCSLARSRVSHHVGCHLTLSICPKPLALHLCLSSTSFPVTHSTLLSRSPPVSAAFSELNCVSAGRKVTGLPCQRILELLDLYFIFQLALEVPVFLLPPQLDINGPIRCNTYCSVRPAHSGCRSWSHVMLFKPATVAVVWL